MTVLIVTYMEGKAVDCVIEEVKEEFIEYRDRIISEYEQASDLVIVSAKIYRSRFIITYMVRGEKVRVHYEDYKAPLEERHKPDVRDYLY